jgi:putative ABC transport system ATP-binding protein
MATVLLNKVFKIYQDRDIKVPALTDVSLEIKPGEFMVLAGPSGSGKTTLLNIIGTLDRPDSGQVYLDGLEVSGLSGNTLAEIRLKKIGFIFQAYNLIDVLTARENVEYVMLLQGMDSRIRRQRSMAVLKAVGLEGLAERKTDQMSGGQGQRVAVARAVAAEPQLILADEPTANLDSKTGEHLIELMESFNRSKQITFVIASHDPMVINRARRIIQLKDGRIMEDRTIDQ